MENNGIKKAFTLAEIMIVLTVIGILTAILLPSAFHSTPDENVMKFKKANSVLFRVINELVTSGQYYTAGDLGKRPNGDNINGGFQRGGEEYIGTDEDIKYFCNTISDILSTKSVNCSTAKTGDNDSITFIQIPSYTPDKDWQNTLPEGKELFDTACQSKAAEVGEEIIANDGVVYYQANPQATFGIIWNAGGNIRLFDTTDANGLLDTYKIMCIDVDGIPDDATEDDCVNECPFGYGIRVDGKIITGARADEWAQKSVQNKD